MPWGLLRSHVGSIYPHVGLIINDQSVHMHVTLHRSNGTYPRVVVRLGLNELCTNLPTRLLLPTPMSCKTIALWFTQSHTQRHTLR